MVETSVAVATPLDHGAADQEGQCQCRQGDNETARHHRGGGAGRHREIALAGAVPDHGAQDQPDDETGQQSAGEQGRDRDAGDGADGDQDQTGRDRFRSARRSPRASATRSPRVAPRSLHFREQHRGDRRHVGRLGAGDAGDEVHRHDQHEGQPASHVADQVGEEPHHDPRHAGHLDQQAEEDEQRHRRAVSGCDMPVSIRATSTESGM